MSALPRGNAKTYTFTLTALQTLTIPADADRRVLTITADVAAQADLTIAVGGGSANPFADNVTIGQNYTMTNDVVMAATAGSTLNIFTDSDLDAVLPV